MTILNDLPDITFVETNPEQILTQIIREYENAYFESTGMVKKLYPGDPIRIFLYTQALREIQLRHVIDDTAKQNLLKYARGNNLDHLGARVRVPRGEEKAAVTRMTLKFSQAFPDIYIIPIGTRFSPGNNLFFATQNEFVLPAGTQEMIINVDCEEKGVIGNDLLPGQINIIVDPLPFLTFATNLDVTQGGVNIESDDDYRESIYLAPASFSVAGPDAAYIYHTKTYSPLIDDVRVSVPSGGVIDIRVLLNEGELPSVTFLEGLNNHFNKSIRPLTDLVQTGAPLIVPYDIEATYYISSEQLGDITSVQEKINSALEEFISWQKSKIGRDVNPSELVFKLREAGAKRVVIVSPSHAVINDTEVANANVVTLNYGGIEDE
ncbi:MAG: baseplate J/gp47 family protein [Paenisporosarcina sp.]